MNDSNRPQRRHDLDALRGIAMLLGIVIHGLLSFIPGAGAFWGVQDSQVNGSYGVVLGLIHGFRMPLFFLVSGFFTAMLFRRRGLRSLVKHRFMRIFLPMLLAMFTILPLNNVIRRYIQSKDAAQEQPADEKEIPWAAVMGADDAAVAKWIKAGGDPNAKSDDGGRPLHVAIIFGYVEVARTLLDAGADAQAANLKGERAIDMFGLNWDITKFIAGLFSVPIDKAKVIDGRKRIAEFIDQRTGGSEASDILRSAGLQAEDGGAGFWMVVQMLIQWPLFEHLWFLWFLCWLVAGFVILALLGRQLGVDRLPKYLILSPLRYAWLIPLTVVAQCMMQEPSFGPDTSIGLIPMPRVLFYYAIFFFAGSLYYDADDQEGVLGKFWWAAIPVSLFVLFPIGLSLLGAEEFGGRVFCAVCQVSYAWLMIFGSMGLFRSLLSSENKTMRYLSDSSYWLYLAHIPIVIYIQYMIRDWHLPSVIKLLIVCGVSSVILLASYQWFVRYTPLGTLLNGKRTKHGKVTAAAT